MSACYEFSNSFPAVVMNWHGSFTCSHVLVLRQKIGLSKTLGGEIYLDIGCALQRQR